mmetsp:Transcript_18180/g.56385  ORF Transcript_18180/g.56385 Transcript_18180/m.56385 type:complete len:357 (+) Transcript_18180:639-1709(+)
MACTPSRRRSGSSSASCSRRSTTAASPSSPTGTTSSSSIPARRRRARRARCRRCSRRGSRSLRRSRRRLDSTRRLGRRPRRGRQRPQRRPSALSSSPENLRIGSASMLCSRPPRGTPRPSKLTFPTRASSRSCAAPAPTRTGCTTTSLRTRRLGSAARTSSGRSRRTCWRRSTPSPTSASSRRRTSRSASYSSSAWRAARPLSAHAPAAPWTSSPPTWGCCWRSRTITTCSRTASPQPSPPPSGTTGSPRWALCALTSRRRTSASGRSASACSARSPRNSSRSSRLPLLRHPLRTTSARTTLLRVVEFLADELVERLPDPLRVLLAEVGGEVRIGVREHVRHGEVDVAKQDERALF